MEENIDMSNERQMHMEELDLHELSLDGEITSRDITRQDLAELDRCIEKAMAYCEDKPDEIKEFLKPVITAACDQYCDMCRQMGKDPLAND